MKTRHLIKAVRLNAAMLGSADVPVTLQTLLSILLLAQRFEREADGRDERRDKLLDAAAEYSERDY